MNGTRTSINLNDGWAFAKKRDWRNWLYSPDGNCDEVVNLPHCWNVKDSFLENVAYYRGYGSYRKSFKLPPQNLGEEDCVWTLEAGGFYGTGDVWMNGSKIAEVDGQYLGFSLDVGKDLRWNAENIVGIRITNKCRSYVLPGIDDPDFLLYGGLAGGVWLEKKPRIHLDSSRTSVRTERIGTNEFAVTMRCAVVNQPVAPQRYNLKCSIKDKDGSVVAESRTEAKGETDEYGVSMNVCGVAFWSPVSPALYRAEFALLEDGKMIDSIRNTVWFSHCGFQAWAGIFSEWRTN